MNAGSPVVAVIGGTGAEGSGLAARWAKAGYRVIVGSRDARRAIESAAAIGAEGMDNRSAAAACDIAVLTVPYAAQRSTLESLRDPLQGKILVDVTVPLVPPRVMRVQLPAEGSAAAVAQAVLGEGVRVVSAFQNVSAHHLRGPDGAADCDVLIAGDAPAARAEVARLAEAAGLRGVEAGPLANAAAAEAMTSLLLWINRRYGSSGAGIRVTGLPEGLPDGFGVRSLVRRSWRVAAKAIRCAGRRRRCGLRSKIAAARTLASVLVRRRGH